MIIKDLKERADHKDLCKNNKGLADLDGFWPYAQWTDALRADPMFSVEDGPLPANVDAYVVIDCNFWLHTITQYKQVPNTRYSYGVADNLSQIYAHHANLLNDPIKNYVILMVPIMKEVQDPEGGWRWHKWGEYIGVQDPQCEYIYNEDNIELVYTFRIIQVEKI